MERQIGGPKQKVEIYVCCRNLIDKDILSKSDPFVIFKMKNNRNGEWKEIGRTEIQKDNLNPNFTKSFLIDYIFEEKQDCFFEVFDYDDENKYESLGEVYTTVGAIVGAKNNTLVMNLLDQQTKKELKKSKIILVSEEVQENFNNEKFLLQCKGIKLMNTDGWFDKSDPFLRFVRVREDNTKLILYETEVIMDNLNPVWNPLEMTIQKLCNGDNQLPIKVECWDWEKSGKNQFIGEFSFTLSQLNEADGKVEFNLQNPKQKNPGKIEFIKLQQPTFLEYIRGDIQLNLQIAVDFTGSNGEFNSCTSLHYLNSGSLNQYQQAIKSVGEILLDYDYDKKVPSYGFGAKLGFDNLKTSSASHCFPLSGNPKNSEVEGLEGIMQAYKQSQKSVTLSGPTNFEPIIQHVVEDAKQCAKKGSKVYTILLIMTDGQISDMEQTKKIISKAETLPLSIIIIGVGSANFNSMVELDGDDQQKFGQFSRDIVQFVPFNKYKNDQIALAREVLAEIPSQLITYMLQHRIYPQQVDKINLNSIQQ